MPRARQLPELAAQTPHPVLAAMAVTCGTLAVHGVMYVLTPTAYSRGLLSFLFVVGPSLFVALPIALAATHWWRITSAGASAVGAMTGVFALLGDIAWENSAEFWQDPSGRLFGIAVYAVIGWIGSRVFWRVWRWGL